MIARAARFPGQRRKPCCHIENQWYRERKGTWGGKKAQDTGVAVVKCLTGTYELGLKDLEVSMDADMPAQEHVSEAMCPFCQGEGKQALWRTENPLYKFLRNAGFLSNHQKSSYSPA